MKTSRPTASTRAALAVTTIVAVALLAMVPAFACTPRSMAQIDPARGEAGSTVNITGSLFDPQYALVVKLGGASGTILATTAVRSDGSAGPVPVTIPVTAEPGKIHVLAVYQPDDPAAKVSNVTFEIPGAPVAAPAPVQPAPAPSADPVPVATATPAPAPAAQSTPAPAAAQPRVRTAPAAETPAPVPAAPVSEEPLVQEPSVPAVVSDTPPDEPVAVPPVVRSTAPAGSIDGGTSLWVLVPLIGFGLVLFAASAAIVVHEVRKRRSAVKA